MKNLSHYLQVVLLLFAIAGCSKESEPEPPGMEGDELLGRAIATGKTKSEGERSREIVEFEGQVAIARPLPPLPMPPHPYQDNRGYAGAHGDSYNSGVIPAAGPLGRDIQVRAFHADHEPAFCSTQHFDAKGRIISVCVGRFGPSTLVLLDPNSMAVLAEQELPPMGGFYFRIDNKGRVVIPAGDMTIQTWEVVERLDKPEWRLVQRRDVSSAVPVDLRGEGSYPLDLVADWQGNWWFSILRPAAVGYITPDGEVKSYLFAGESIANGLAAAPDGVYFVSDRKLYGMRAGDSGPEVFLVFPYEVGEEAAKASFGSGSGTTPVLFGNDLIAFGDNADPRPNVLVYRLDDVADDERLVCKVPVFKPGRSVLENSFIGYDHSLVIENNKGFKMVGGSADAEPGFVRIDVRRDLSGCDTVWENYEVRAGTGAKLSLGNGLIYVHELLMGTAEDWYVTAIDFHTGRRVWRKYVGSGQEWDNSLLTMSIGPDGLLTSGMYAGILGARDIQ